MRTYVIRFPSKRGTAVTRVGAKSRHAAFCAALDWFYKQEQDSLTGTPTIREEEGLAPAYWSTVDRGRLVRLYWRTRSRFGLIPEE